MIAWKRGVKTLYYCRSEAYKRAEVVSDEKLRDYVFDYDDEGCLACEGYNANRRKKLLQTIFI